MHHSITILDKKQNQRVFKNGRHFIHNWLSSSVVNFIKETFKVGKGQTVMVISSFTETDIEYIKNFIKEKSYKKIYIFIEDVFRMSNHRDNNFLETWFLEKYPDETRCYEMETIKTLIESLPETLFEIYHCESNTKIIEKIYNLKIKYFDWFIAAQCQKKYRPVIDYNFEHKLCCFNLRPQENRFLIGALLKNKPDTYITLNNYHPDETSLLSMKSFDFYKFSLDLQKEILTSHNQLKKIENFKTLPPKIQDRTLYIIKNSFVQIVSETRYASPMPNFSEKTLKSLWAFRPFILMAPPNTLKHLRLLGFKTFGKYWDESYDFEEDHQKRFEKIYKLSQDILKKDKSELESLLKDMTPILEHNFHHVKKLKESMYTYDLLHIS